MKSRREFLKKSLKVGAVVSTGVLATTSLASQKSYDSQNQNGVVTGNAKKKEVLYWESEAWKKYYKIAY